MKKILHIGMTPNPGGIESFVINLYRNIDRNKYEFHFVNWYDEKLAYEDELIKMGGEIHKISSRRNSILKNKQELKKIIEEQNFCYIHNHVQTLSYIEGIKLGLNKKIPTIIHAHSESIDKNAYITKFLNFINSRYGKKETINLAASYRAGENMFGSQQFEVVPNAIDLKTFQYDENTRKRVRKNENWEKKIVIGHVGRFSYPKNHEFILKVFSMLEDEKANVFLALVGDGELREEIMREVKNNKLENKVCFLGIRENINELLMGMDYFIFPSIYEAFPISVLEAQSTGLPCVISSNISKDVILTDLVTQLSIEDDEAIKNWVKAIKNKSIESNRAKYYQKIKSSGFDISELVEIMYKIYK